MKRSAIHRQRELFKEPPSKLAAVLPAANRAEVVQLLSKLLGEVTDARTEHSTDTEASDDQD